MTPRVSPTEAIRAEIDEMIAGAERGSLLEHFEEVARAAVRLVFQTALEKEVTEFFGRERYARGEREHEGSRNGYSPLTIKTTAGRDDPAAPEDPGQSWLARLARLARSQPDDPLHPPARRAAPGVVQSGPHRRRRDRRDCLTCRVE